MSGAAHSDERRRVSPAVRVSVAVQHHPSRARLLPDLLALLPARTEVVTDPDPDAELPSPLRTYCLALQLTPADATHRLVVQDDAVPCQQFASKMLAAVAEHPESLVAFFTPGCAPHRAKIERAALRGEAFAWLTGNWFPTVALCWPAELAREFAAWAPLQEKLPGLPFQGDDGPVGTWIGQRRNVQVWATVPSLVQHPDVERSLIGRPNRAGKNRARVAAMFTD